MRNGVTSMARIDYIERLNLLLRDPERKSIFRIIPELLAVWLRNRNTPSDYYQCLLFKKYMTNIYDFVGNNYGCKIRDSLNSPSWLCLLDNKLFFHLYFEGKGVRIPRLLAFSFGRELCVDGTWLLGKNESDFSEAFRRIVSLSENESVFAKPTTGIGGYGAFILTEDGISRVAAEYHRLMSTDYIYEDLIHQHPDISYIYPGSVNTLRVDTVKDDNGLVTPISATLRMGVGGSYVDNASSGGCFAGVHLDSGELRRYAYSLPKNGGARFTQHPDTDVVFEGTRIPLFNEVVKLACDAAQIVPDRNVGWDIAIACDGPVLVEGNSDYGIRLSEVAFGGYRKNPVYREMMMNYRKDTYST
jgi:hypothetical protein